MWLHIAKIINKKFNYFGFTLIELLVVIAIIAVLAAIVAPNAFRAIEKGKVAKLISDLKAFKTAALAYYADTGQWPPHDRKWGANEEISFFITGQGQPAGWNGPYLERWPDPPWRCAQETVARGSYDWFNAVSAGRPLLGITVSCVPRSAALRVDRDLDDGNLNTGRVRYWNFVGGWLYLSVTLAAL